LGSFSCSIPPSFVPSHNMPMINATSNWLRFGVFLSPAVPSLRTHWSLTTDYCSPAPRRDQRVQAGHRPSPAGYCLTPTAELSKTERGPISTIGLSLQYVTEPGDRFGQIKLLWALAGWCARTGGRRPFSEGATVPVCSGLRTNWRAPSKSAATSCRYNIE